MPGYLHNVALRIAHKTPGVLPRIPSQFEPEERNTQAGGRQTPLDEVSEEVVSQRPRPASPSVPESSARSHAFDLPHVATPHHLTERTNEFMTGARVELHAPPASREPSPPRILRNRHRVIVPQAEPIADVGEPSEARQLKHAGNKKPAANPLSPGESPEASVPGVRPREEVPGRQVLRPRRGENASASDNGLRPTSTTDQRDTGHLEQSAGRSSSLGAFSPPPPPLQRTDSSPEVQATRLGDIHIAIGRLTVQAILPVPSPLPALTPARPAPRLTLEQYLQEREGRR